MNPLRTLLNKDKYDPDYSELEIHVDTHSDTLTIIHSHDVKDINPYGFTVDSAEEGLEIPYHRVRKVYSRISIGFDHERRTLIYGKD